MSKFLINKYGYYFQVDCSVDVKKAECVEFPDLPGLYFGLYNLFGLQFEETAGAEILINVDGMVMLEPEGCAQNYDTLGCVDSFLLNYNP